MRRMKSRQGKEEERKVGETRRQQEGHRLGGEAEYCVVKPVRQRRGAAERAPALCGNYTPVEFRVSHYRVQFIDVTG